MTKSGVSRECALFKMSFNSLIASGVSSSLMPSMMTGRSSRRPPDSWGKGTGIGAGLAFGLGAGAARVKVEKRNRGKNLVRSISEE